MLKNIDSTTAAILKRFRFDAEVLDRTRSLILAGTTESTRLSGAVSVPAPEDFARLPGRDSAEGRALAALGQAAIARGEVGVVVLAGGMATRFGGIVKAVADVVQGSSFLHLKLADVEAVAQALGGTVPVFLMTSFATRDQIEEMLREAPPLPHAPVEILEQSVSLRLNPTGEMARDAAGNVLLCATGHGDLLSTLRVSGALSRFREQGGKTLMVSNVDNLAATLDPRVVGAHVQGGRSVTVEVVAKQPGDRGGAALRVSGHLQIVEEFRLPAGFDRDLLPYFNTNTFAFDAAAIDRDFDLDWFLVRRKADGQEVIQAERLLGQVTAFLSTQFLIVERRGSEGRFLPVKDREELKARLPEIQALLDSRGH